MEQTPTPKISVIVDKYKQQRMHALMHFPLQLQSMLLLLTVMLFLGSMVIAQQHGAAYAAERGRCNSWYRIQPGDTLGRISSAYRVNIWSIARINHIANINLIFSGRELCISSSAGGAHAIATHYGGSGLQVNGNVRWYDYSALAWSSRGQVASLIRQAAYRHGLPPRLLLAVAWQESGWNQHVISRDGGIGTMQVMPYTARGLDVQTGIRYNPYNTWDNIELGAIYLHSLWVGLRGNQLRVISAYNEGGWAVVHRGIFNWRYVNNVLALMRRF